MSNIKDLTTEEMMEELKKRGKNSKEISEFLHSKGDVQETVTDVLREIGIPAHIKGYYYVRHAIMLCIENPEYVMSVTKKLYPDVAKEFDTTSSRVERAIRHAIEVAWERGTAENWKKYFGNTVANMKKNPTNSEFVATISDMIKIRK